MKRERAETTSALSGFLPLSMDAATPPSTPAGIAAFCAPLRRRAGSARPSRRAARPQGGGASRAPRPCSTASSGRTGFRPASRPQGR